MKTFTLIIFILSWYLSSIDAQHTHTMKMPDTEQMSDSMMKMPQMTHAYSVNLPMNVDGSGTSWLPQNSPMYGYMFHTKSWNFMFHGNIFVRYNKQDIANKGTRGAELWDAPNWLMMMGQSKVGGKGLFHFNAMFSLDYAIVGGAGYPLLFQTGESNKGVPLVDRQHPHDLFSELSVSYSYALSNRSDIYIYLGYPGEPAIGSVAFMHRPSAMPIPDAPISHHWNDGTHITFGVATLGFRYGKFKWEASSFTGREPDENRYNFDKPRFDSWSGRISFIPTPGWSWQVSSGFIKSPELLHPDEDVWRTTASAIFTKKLSNRTGINLTGLWGLNKIKDNRGENAFLLEGDWNISRLTLFGRYEWVQKDTEELNLNENTFGNSVFPVNALTLGFNLGLIEFKNTWLTLGSHLIFFSEDNKLQSLYGKNPMSFEVYLRIHPGVM